MEGFTSARICTGRITRTVTPEDSVLLRTLTSSVSISVVISMSGIYRGVRTRVYPGRQARPIRAASTFLVTGMGPGSSGDLARSWVVTQLWLHLYHQLTKRSGRRAPVLEGGGHSCPFVSSDGDAARECAKVNQSIRDRLTVNSRVSVHGGRLVVGIMDSTACNTATRPSAHLLIP